MMKLNMVTKQKIKTILNNQIKEHRDILDNIK